MQKVSRTMLAVLAAIQSGAHTRRKPKYIKEQALVSGLYPYFYEETISGAVAFAGGKLFDAPNITDTINGSVAFAGGELIQFGPIEYTIQPETVSGNTVFAGGTLAVYDPEEDIEYAVNAEVTAGVTTFAGGELKIVLVSYSNYEAELTTGVVAFAGGALEIV